MKTRYSDKISSSQGILLQNCQRSSSAKNMIDVSPEPYLDLIDNPFNTLEWNQLSLGKIFQFLGNKISIVFYLI